MKVVHLFRTSSQGYGLERNILCTLPGLAQRGAETVAVAVTERDSGHAPRDFVRQLEAAGVRFITVPSGGRLPFKLAGSLSKIFAAETPQILHSHGYKCDLAMLLAETGDAVRMTTVHGWLSRTWRERFYEWVNVKSCRRMDLVIVFCEDYKRRLLSRGVPEHLVRVVPVGMDLGVVPEAKIDFRERWGVPDDGILIAQLGRLSPEKGPDLFVKVAIRLSERFPQARFALVGTGVMLDHLRRQAAGRPSSILFAGHVHEMADVLEAVDVAVNCSSTEGLPRSLLEAGAAGVPAVATAIGGVPDVIVHGATGILCPAGDVGTLETGVAHLIEDVEVRRRMGATAQQRVRTVFSTETCTDHLIETYNLLLAGTGTPP